VSGSANIAPTGDQRIGALLRGARRDAGLSLADAATKTRHGAASIGSWERGQRAMPAYALPALAGAYGVTVRQLLGEAEPVGRTEHVVLDLDALARHGDLLAGGLLLRWTDSIRHQRNDWGGTVLSIRSEDLDRIAMALELWPGDLLEALDSWGVLAPTSAGAR
jgi:transcriptional regulator with XRE-family HTH domain